MAALDAVSLTIMFGALLVLAGILSSLVALRFGAPLLLVFLLVGMLAGESGPGGIAFDDVHTTYLVGSVALALILFDGGLRTRLATFRSVIAPSLVLATIGVLLTAALTAPAARYLLGFDWVGIAPGRRGGVLDRCGGGVPAHSFPRAAAAPPCRGDARDRIRDQRSVRDLSHHRAGRRAIAGRRVLDLRPRTSSRSKRSAARCSASSADGRSCWRSIA